MSNPRCAVCGQVNRLGAELCELCDSRLDESQPGAYAARFHGEEPRAGALPTDIPSPHFQGAGDAISPTLEVYRKNFALVGLLVLATTLPLLLIQFLTSRTVEPAGTGGIGAGAGGYSLYTLTDGGWGFYWVMSLLANSLLEASLVYAVIDLQRAGASSVGACLRRGLGKLPRVLGLSLVCYLMVYGGAFLLVALGWVLLGPAGAFILLLLLVLPYIVVTLTLSLAVPAAVAENRGVFDSIGRSAELTRGHKGLIFLTYFIWSLVTTVVGLVVTASFLSRGVGGWSSSPAMFLQTFVGELLKSTTYVLTTYIFLGILKERRQSAEAHAPYVAR